MKHKKSSFYPSSNLDGKHNYKKFSLIKKNGDVIERILLNIPNDFLREDIICRHFLKKYVQLFIKEETGVNVVSRDSPWDFRIELSNSEIFNIEITSIADEEAFFRKMKYEERMDSIQNEEKIPFHELKKMHFNFPSSETSSLVDLYKERNFQNNDLVDNPFRKQFLFISSMSEDLKSFDSLLKDVIYKKLTKKHSDKENTILLIDNRTVSFEIEDVRKGTSLLESFINNLPFKEVWIYTGYFSDLMGNNSAFTLMPIKVSDNTYKIMKKLSHKGIINI